MTHFEFEHPWILLFLLLVICIYKCPLSVKKIIFPHLHLFGKNTHLLNREKLLYSLIFASMITALANPITYSGVDANHKKGRDLVFALDTSGSMDESGYSEEKIQQSKFAILLEIMKKFVSSRFDDNVGVVVFGSFAFSPVPITYDMHSLVYMLDFLTVGMAGDSTAIGDGLARSLEMLAHSQAKNKVIVLVTDGYQNSGTTKIKDAVTKAKKIGVKIYTIGIGKESSFDKKLLDRIAQDTDGVSFTATNEEALQDIYKELNTLEPSAIRSEHYLNKEELFTYPLAVAVLLLLYLLTKREGFDGVA